MIQTGFRGLTIEDDNHINEDISRFCVGFVVLFDYDDALGIHHRNISSPEQVHALTSTLKGAADYPLFIAVDQEGGRVNRLKAGYGFPEMLSHRKLGEIDDPEYTYNHAKLIAETIKNAGIDLNLAPVVDLGIDKENPIIYGKERTFSDDPSAVTRHALAYIKAHRETGVATALKHFPGHGSSRHDTHIGMVDVTRTWSESELEPYRKIIDAGMCDMIMTTHVFNQKLDPDFPATLSGNILTGILRERMGYDGVLMTDDLQMHAIRNHFGMDRAIELAILAGADIINIGNNMEYRPDAVREIHETVHRMLDKGIISESRIDESFMRITNLKKRYSNITSTGG